MSDAADPQPPAATLPGENRESNDMRYSKLLKQKRGEFLDHLLRSLDMIAYCHFSYLYFLDCSLFRFVIRSAIQLNFLTPKPPNFPVHSQRRPAIVALFGSTAFCFLCHILGAAPSAGELSNGYLHGGFIIDFIGQEGPISKWRLGFMDARNITPAQDLESEERGETRRHSFASLNSNRSSNVSEARRPDETPLMDSDEHTIGIIVDGSSESERERLRRVFELTSGEFVAAELKVVEVIQQQWRKTDIPTGGGGVGSTASGGSSRERRRL
ncbi:uncharacterized protein H6S33_001201 [Morchella sextelata]|uniref:uncharacterized protein n=1 Tax=Morchella sextelata TaxID=1174677 RepID=UPI001D04F37A|nr:uncharacterized protein H6S33_001201 [Morchella sextelata]KAH0608973.1 hypothetical protein H6S33_001201 [Morchella sextelata]